MCFVCYCNIRVLSVVVPVSQGTLETDTQVAFWETSVNWASIVVTQMLYV